LFAHERSGAAKAERNFRPSIKPSRLFKNFLSNFGHCNGVGRGRGVLSFRPVRGLLRQSEAMEAILLGLETLNGAGAAVMLLLVLGFLLGFGTSQ
jgi:hypothetical protein